MANLARILGQKMRMLREDAMAVARVVENAFKGRDELDDEALDKDLRQLFYDLQDEKILDVRRKEYVADGQLLRGYHWYVREVVLDPTGPERPMVDPDEEVYLHLGDRAWQRRPVDGHPQS